MEKHLDAPGVLEEAKRRHIFALELQKKSLVQDISFAQRKLVHNFQYKLKTSASMAKRHQAWMNEAELAKRGSWERGQVEKCTRNVDSFMANRNSSPWLNKELRKSNRRPKTAGGKTAQLCRQLEIDAYDELNQRKIISAGKKSHIFDKQGASNECGRAVQGSFILNENNGKSLSKRTVHVNVEGPPSNALQENGKGYLQKNLNVRSTINQQSKQLFGYFGSGHFDKNKVVAQQTIKNDHRKSMAALETGPKTKDQTTNIEETGKSMSYRFDGKKREFSEKREREILKNRDREDNNDDEKKRPGSRKQNTSDSSWQTNNISTSSHIKQWQRRNIRPQTAPNIHSNHQSDIKADLRRRRKALSTAKTNDTTQGSEEFKKSEMSCEMRSWICDIQRDVERVRCPETNDNHYSEISIETKYSENCLKNEKYTDSALEKFEAIFNNIYVNDHDYSFYTQSIGPIEKLDIASLYLKSAVADSQKHGKQTWNLRDPRNKKLQPNIFL